MNLKEMLERRAGIFQTMQALVDKAKAEQRELTAEETVVYDSLETDFEAMKPDIERARRHEARTAEMAQSIGTLIGARGGTAEPVSLRMNDLIRQSAGMA